MQLVLAHLHKALRSSSTLDLRIFGYLLRNASGVILLVVSQRHLNHLYFDHNFSIRLSSMGLFPLEILDKSSRCNLTLGLRIYGCHQLSASQVIKPVVSVYNKILALQIYYFFHEESVGFDKASDISR